MNLSEYDHDSTLFSQLNGSKDIFKALYELLINGAAFLLCFFRFTSARTAVWRHGVSIFGTSTLIAARNIHTLIGTQMANALGTLIDVWASRKNINHLKMID